MRFSYSLCSGCALPLTGVEGRGLGLAPLVLSPLLLLPPRTLSAQVSWALDRERLLDRLPADPPGPRR
ncbi:hypothetical protein MTO96_003995 [Rhipicephalus appendiculatus]